MAFPQPILIFGIFKAYISNFANYNLYQRKLKVITRTKNTLHFLIRTLGFFGGTREDSVQFYESLKKNLKVVSK